MESFIIRTQVRNSLYGTQEAIVRKKRDENIYLAEVTKTYFANYDANNSPAGSSIMRSDPNKYTSEDTVIIMDQASLFPLMGNIVKFGYDFDGWNMEVNGTVTDYDPGQETNLTEPLPLCEV